MTNTSDFVRTEADLRALASDHGLPVIFAVFPNRQVLLDARTPLRTLIEVAKASGAAFISLDAVPFDAEEFVDEARRDLSRDDLVLTDEGIALIEREGRKEATVALTMEWGGGGLAYSVTFRSDWSTALSERVAKMTEPDPEPSWREVWVRINDLATQIEAMPEFRAIQPSKRRAAGEELILAIAVDSDDSEMRRRAVDEAAKTANRNGQRAHFAFQERRMEAATALTATTDWSLAWSRPARIAVATRFLTATVGYAPTISEAEAFVRLALGKS